MSTDYMMVCHTCKKVGPCFASGSISYGFKVWKENPELLVWLGHRESIGHHEGHDLRIVSEHSLPFSEEEDETEEPQAQG